MKNRAILLKPITAQYMYRRNGVVLNQYWLLSIDWNVSSPSSINISSSSLVYRSGTIIWIRSVRHGREEGRIDEQER